jgi:hypothetical protein
MMMARSHEDLGAGTVTKDVGGQSREVGMDLFPGCSDWGMEERVREEAADDGSGARACGGVSVAWSRGTALAPVAASDAGAEGVRRPCAPDEERMSID